MSKSQSTENDSRRLVEGQGQFVGDLEFPRMLHLSLVRSPHARARLLKVQGGINASELKATMSSVGEGGGEAAGVIHPVLASGFVNYVGQPVAGVLAEDPYDSEDKIAEVDVEYEPLKAIVNPEAALVSPALHPDTTSNVFGAFKMGKDFELSTAEFALEDTLLNRRVSPNPLEPRGLVADYDGSILTVWASTQSVHAWKEGLCASLGLEPNSVRVIQVDTGGAFGCKGGIYPEYVIASYAAMKLRRPVKWVETRMEHEVATNQGRGAQAKMKIYADKTGTIHGLKAELLIDAGAYAMGMGEMTPRWIGYQITGPYMIPQVYVDAKAVYTNKVPLGPYRGAGRPEAAIFIERMMDLLADELKMDPVEVRLRNASSQSYTSPLGLKLDPFKPFLESAVKELGYYNKRETESVGFAAFVLIPATQPGESARIVVENGRVKVWLGGNTHGQGHDVWVRLLIAEELGVSGNLVDFEYADTQELNEGVGSWGSRSVVVAGAALVEAARMIKTRCEEKYGTYTSAKLLAHDWDEKVFHSEKGQLNSFGANLVTAYLDADGRVRVGRCVAYYDVGRPLNPAMIESQIVGGSAQGIGQVLTEEVIYGEDGQMLTATIGDAGILSAIAMPQVEVKLANTPSNLPHGAKGLGESPTMGVPPAAVRAIEKIVGRRLRETPIPIEVTMLPHNLA